MLPRVLSVSDFQGCESFRPSAKVNLPSLLFDNIITVISSESLPCRRRSLTTPTFLFLSCFVVSANWTPVAPFGSRLIHSFACRSFNTTAFSTSTTAFSATADSDITSLLLYSFSIYSSAPVVELLAAPSCSSQRYVHSDPSLLIATSRPSASQSYISKSSSSNALITSYLATSQAALNTRSRKGVARDLFLNYVVLNTLTHRLCHCWGSWGSYISSTTTQEHAHPTTEKPETAESDTRAAPHAGRRIHQKPHTYGHCSGTYRARYQHDREVCPDMVSKQVGAPHGDADVDRS